MNTYITIRNTPSFSNSLRNQIPSEYNSPETEFRIRIENVINANVITSKQSITLLRFTDYVSNVMLTTLFLSDCEILYSVENEIIFSLITPNGIKTFYIDEDGDFGFNETPFSGNSVTVFGDFGDENELIQLISQFVA